MAVFTAIGASIFGAGTFLAAVTAGALQVAAGIGVSLIAKAVAGEPQGPKFGVQAQLQGGDDVPRSIIFGRACTAGSLVYHNTWGTANGVPNAFHTRVIAIADYPIQSLDRVFVQELLGTLLKSEAHPQYGWPVQEYRKEGVDHLWVKFYDGTQTTADSFLVNSVANTERPYGTDRIGRGVPYAIVTAMAPERKDGEEKPIFNGVPAIKFEVTGARLYDPSRDSTVSGGSGAQRLNNPATWGGDGDHFPVVQALNLMLGIRFGEQWLYGLQSLNVNRTPLADAVVQINRCRTPFRAGGTSGSPVMEPQYRTGGEVQVGAQIKTTIEALMTGCQGRMIETGGTYKFRVGAPGEATFAFTDLDIMETHQQSFTPFYGLEDSINGILSTFPNPNEAWKTKTAVPLYRTDLEVRDGNRRLMANVSLDLVWSISQVERLQRSALEEAQRARRHTFVLGPEAWVLEPGDIVAWTSVRNGYAAKLFRVDGVGDRGDLEVLVDITEVDPSDYDWSFDDDFRPVFDGPITLVPTPSLPMIGWQAYGVSILDNDGVARRPGIEVAYQPGLQNVESVRIQVRMPGATNPFIDLIAAYGDPWRTQIAGNLINNTQYEVRGIYVTFDRTRATWSAWLGVTTPDVKLVAGKDFDPFEGLVGWDQLEDEIRGWTEWIGQTPRELIEAIQNVDTHLSNTGSATTLALDEIRREVGVSFEDADARFTEVVTVAIVPLQEGYTALADQLTVLEAQVGNVQSNVTVRGTAVASPGGGWARWGVQVRTGVGEEWSSGAFFLDVNGSLSRAVFAVDQFIVTNAAGTLTENPFVVDGTALRVGNALVRNASIGDAEITGAKIQDAAIERAKIASAAVGTAEIDNLAVTNAKIDALAVTTAKIGNLAVETIKIADGAVTEFAEVIITSPVNYVPASNGTIATLAFPGGNYPVTVSVWMEVGALLSPGNQTTTGSFVLEQTTGGTTILVGPVQVELPANSSGLPAAIVQFNFSGFPRRPGQTMNFRLRQTNAGTLTHRIHFLSFTATRPKK